ncbi:activating signal cointegrator 1 complex subunit 1 isoform X2 [Hyla sarda]|nr:activating signal cointegrator 1 complex subunit 1 isoform X2 [Hyla sarda]XP_056386440.1 activating signal cointegrator 1 complex subunit 1 isoform X2 [Hyla sarda]XP_056386441.1 activating signal cointegrator 1 complex subunit 1 isoform X2 [Hyla sarda]XP_056386442.1 activating signal cointegrator 1 complex subunit 1 isoform X2 [Hyla sarda]
MEVLRPTLINIEGRIYRKNTVQEATYQNEEEEDDFYKESMQCLDEPCDDFMIEETEKGFQCSINLPSQLFKYIIGKKGETKRNLESETHTSISIPRQGMEGKIVITGHNRNGVISARTRIELLAETFRKKQPFTHFLSFALNQPEIQDSFLKFKEEVLSKCSKDHGIDSSIFQNPAKLHLTIGTLVLLNETEVTQASQLLHSCKEDFLDKIAAAKPMKVEVSGIEYMNDDPAMVDVLYAKVQMKDGSERLQLIADRLMQKFVGSGLMLKDWDRVKLHATVMNTLFRRDPLAEERSSIFSAKPGQRERESFDARNILKLFDNFYFGEINLDTVHLSQRFSVDSCGYYTSAGQVQIS